MGWTGGALQGPFTARAAIEFEFGAEFLTRVIDTVRYGTVIYAAVRARDEQQIFGLVLLAERQGGILYTKPISEACMGPSSRISAQLASSTADRAQQRFGHGSGANAAAPAWPSHGRATVRPSPSPRRSRSPTAKGASGTVTYQGGSRFCTDDGCLCRITRWRELDFTVMQ